MAGKDRMGSGSGGMVKKKPEEWKIKKGRRVSGEQEEKNKRKGQRIGSRGRSDLE